MTSLCARLRTKVGCSLGTGRPLLCLGSGARESSLSAGKGLRQAALLCAQHPRPRGRAARQPAHGRRGTSDCQEREGLPQGGAEPRSGSGSACTAVGRAHGTRVWRGSGGSAASRAWEAEPRLCCEASGPQSRGWRRNSRPPASYLRGLGDFAGLPSLLTEAPLTCWRVMADWPLPLQGPALVAPSPPCVLRL